MHHLPVQKKKVGRIHITSRDYQGAVVLFKGGKVLVVLYFRKKSGRT